MLMIGRPHVIFAVTLTFIIQVAPAASTFTIIGLVGHILVPFSTFLSFVNDHFVVIFLRKNLTVSLIVRSEVKR